jgi:uncharacterized protein YciI
MENKFNTPHFVALTFLKKDGQQANLAADVIHHRAYYEQFKIKKKLLFYGEVLNESALYIVISVSSDDEFEQIISNDPCINSNVFELKAVTPFMH